MAQKPESRLTRKILAALREEGAWSEKVHGNIYQRGLPDIIASYRGACIGLEVKMPKGKVTPLQRATLLAMRKAGAYAYVVRSTAQARRVLALVRKDQLGASQA